MPGGGFKYGSLYTFFDAVYDKALQQAYANGLDEKTCNLMTKQHIRWEYNIHKIGYGTGISSIREHCEKANLNVDETIWAIIKRGWESIWE